MILYDQTRGNMGPPSNHREPLARGKPIHVGCWRNRRRHIIHLLWPEPQYFFWFPYCIAMHSGHGAAQLSPSALSWQARIVDGFFSLQSDRL